MLALILTMTDMTDMKRVDLKESFMKIKRNLEFMGISKLGDPVININYDQTFSSWRY